jgi:DNA/RNA-binding protein KIN17
MLLVAENPDKYVGSYTREFQQEFVKLLSRRHGTKRVLANQVYQEYISDRNHLHMNATRWNTLSDFVKHLGKEGICHVEETEKGWYITWIDNSPKALARQVRLPTVFLSNLGLTSEHHGSYIACSMLTNSLFEHM